MTFDRALQVALDELHLQFIHPVKKETPNYDNVYIFREAVKCQHITYYLCGLISAFSY